MEPIDEFGYLFLRVIKRSDLDQTRAGCQRCLARGIRLRHSDVGHRQSSCVPTPMIHITALSQWYVVPPYHVWYANNHT